MVHPWLPFFLFGCFESGCFNLNRSSKRQRNYTVKLSRLSKVDLFALKQGTIYIELNNKKKRRRKRLRNNAARQLQRALSLTKKMGFNLEYLSDGTVKASLNLKNKDIDSRYLITNVPEPLQEQTKQPKTANTEEKTSPT